MAVAQTSLFSTKLKLEKPLAPMLENNNFLKWTESSGNSDKNSSPIFVALKSDPNCFIIYWRDWSQKTEYLDISSIRDVKTGKYANVPKDKNTREFLFAGKSNSPIQDRTISIYYGFDFCNIQVINFVSVVDNSVEIAKSWTNFLLKCITNQRMQNLSPWDNLVKLRSCLLYGRSVHKNNEFKLPVQTLIDVLASNSKSGESEKQDIIEALHSVGLPNKKSDLIDEKILTVEKFYKLFIRILTTRDIDPIFLNYATKTKQYLNPDKFETFLNKEQRDPGLNELLYPFYTIQKATELIQKFEIDESMKKKRKLSAEGLMRYLMDFENEIVDPVKYELCEDMDQPLTHYFINSSHNTYLTGHQFTGKSDPEMYRQVLLSGCRCIELDCHEDDHLDEPIITHKNSLCSKILFSEVIHAIKESAFKTSPYPVLLSFENYCGKKMQEKMVKYLKDILGEQLLVDPLPDHPLIPGVPLPSPEQLKYKILIKFRKKRSEKIQETRDSLSRNQSSHSTYDYSNSEPLNLSSEILELTNRFIPKADSIQTISDTSDDEKDESICKRQVSSNTSENSYNRELSIFNEMAQLVNYLQPTTFRSFEICQKRNKSYEMSSFVETSAFNLHKDKSTDFVNYNKRQFSRIYPKGSRISSDNFIPQLYWNVGCQMVALNFQTLDTGMQLNLGKFEYNNRCGYLLKPEIMRRTDVNKLFDPLTDTQVDGIVATTLTIRVISGTFLNNARGENSKRTGQSVTVELYGLPADSVRGQKAHRVKASSNKLFSVLYSDPNGYKFNRIIMPQLAMLKITAYDEQNKMIGFRVLPVVGLRPGYRFVCLKNESNQQLLMTCLFVHIKIEDYVPPELQDLAWALVNPISYVSKLSKDEIVKNLTDDVNENPLQVNGLSDLEDESEIESFSKLSKSANNLNIIDIKGFNICDLKPRENRFSLSVEKRYEINKSDLLGSKSLSTSMFNIPRSHSLFLNDTCTRSQNILLFLNNSNLFAEIDMEKLKRTKTNQQIVKACAKKCQRLEKECEKKIKELNDSLIIELERRRSECVKEKVKIEKKQKLFPLKASKSTIDFETSLKNLNLTTTEKYVRRMKEVYEDTFTKIKNIRLICLQTLYNRIEKLIADIHDNRLQQLKILHEKEISLINKQTHQMIKDRKKKLSDAVQDREELSRMIKKIEKESVSYAVSENSKLEDTMKKNQKLIKQLIDNCLENLRDYKDKQIVLYKNEFLDRLSHRKLELDKKYLFDSALNPNTVLENLYSLHLSRSVGSLNQTVLNNSYRNKSINNTNNNDQIFASSNENITRL